MLNFYKTMENKLVQLPKEEEGCWVRVTRPTQDEIEYLVNRLQLDSGFVSASLDEEEASRMEKEDDQTFVVVDVPYRVEDEETTITYITIPLGIIITPKYFVTISSSETAVIDEIVDGTVRNVETRFRTRFLLIILLRIAQRFLLYLKQIERLSLPDGEPIYQFYEKRGAYPAFGAGKISRLLFHVSESQRNYPQEAVSGTDPHPL